MVDHTLRFSNSSQNGKWTQVVENTILLHSEPCLEKHIYKFKRLCTKRYFAKTKDDNLNKIRQKIN